MVEAEHRGHHSATNGGLDVNRLQIDALLLKTADGLRTQGSWCGETHLQKATYLLQELLEVPTGFGFILYKHGPFSFDLREELASMRADDFLRIVPSPPYGPSLKLTKTGKDLLGRYPKTVALYQEKISFVCQRLGSKGVGELERLATALYVAREDPSSSPQERIKELLRLKPHISETDASVAVETVDRYSHEAEAIQA